MNSLWYSRWFWCFLFLTKKLISFHGNFRCCQQRAGKSWWNTRPQVKSKLYWRINSESSQGNFVLTCSTHLTHNWFNLSSADVGRSSARNFSNSFLCKCYEDALCGSGRKIKYFEGIVFSSLNFRIQGTRAPQPGGVAKYKNKTKQKMRAIYHKWQDFSYYLKSRKVSFLVVFRAK